MKTKTLFRTQPDALDAAERSVGTFAESKPYGAQL